VTRDELIAELELDDDRLEKLVKAGLPIEPDGSFDHFRVVGWLTLTGQGTAQRLVDRRTLATYFGTSEANVRHWRASGMPAASGNRFDLDEVVKWRLDKLAARGSESREALQRAKADREELAADREAGRLVDAYEIDAWQRQTVLSIKALVDDFADLAFGVVDRGLSAEDARRTAQEKIDAIYQDLEAGEKELQEMLTRWYAFLADHFDDAERWLVMWRGFCDQVAPQFSSWEELRARLKELGFVTE